MLVISCAAFASTIDIAVINALTRKVEQRSTPTSKPRYKGDSMRQQYTAVVIGGTGNVGQRLVKQLLRNSSFSKVITISRQPLKLDNQQLTDVVISKAIFNAESLYKTTKEQLEHLDEEQVIVFSTLGMRNTNRHSIEAHRQVDVELNLAFAKACKESGVENFVLLGTSSHRFWQLFSYNKVRIEVEDAIKQCKFKHFHVVRVDTILGLDYGLMLNIVVSVVSKILPGRHIQVDALAEEIIARGLKTYS